MRLSIFVLLVFTALLGVWSKASVEARGLRVGVVTSSVVDAEAQPGKLSVDINVNKSGDGGRWYANPLWIAIGGLALILLLVLVVMATRGGGTTVVK